MQQVSVLSQCVFHYKLVNLHDFLIIHIKSNFINLKHLLLILCQI